MDFPQMPQTSAPFPATPQPATPPSFPNVTPPPTPDGSANPQPIQIPVQAHVGAISSDDQVYTMPEKFLNGTAPGASPIVKAKKPNKIVTIVLIVVIVLMVLAAIGGVLYYFLVLTKQPVVETTADQAVVVNNSTTPNANNTNQANTNTVATVNSNRPGNLNKNVNKNVNSNVNSTAAVNNTNGLVNENDNSNTNTNASVTNVNANNNVNVEPVSAKDTDEDSLTNDEEKIWGTKADLPDSDSDGYADGVEILAGYDPTNPLSAGRLADSSLVGTFSNAAYRYTILYPKNWLAEALAEGDSAEVLFTPNTLDLTGQFVAVTATDNPTGLTALDWYSQTANLDEANIVTLTSFTGLAGVVSSDATTAYFADSNYIYAVSYRYGLSDELYFPSTFILMAKSFALVGNAN